MALGIKPTRFNTVDKYEEGIAFQIAVLTGGRVKYPQAREYVNKQRDASAPYHENIHDIQLECCDANTAMMLADGIVEYYGL